MKKLILILIFFSAFGLFAAKPVVAVLEIENKTTGNNKLTRDEAELIADLMRSELIQSNEFDVMRKDEMELAIAKHVKQSHQLNRDSKYAIELGKTISAKYIIITHIKSDGKDFRIFAEMIDTEIGRSPRSGKARFSRKGDSKDAAITSLINQLLGIRERRTSRQEASALPSATETNSSLYWSEKAPKKMNLNEAQGYCSRLKEGGNSGWRLPSIDELRMLIRNCSATQSSGSCKVSENNGCLASKCLQGSCQCVSNKTGKYSIFGDTEYLWSSSLKSNDRAYLVDFSRGGISSQYIGNSYSVRCVK